MNMTKDIAEEVGIHIGDGSMNIYKNIPTYTVACNSVSDREFITNTVAPLIRKIYKIEPKLRNWSKGSFGFRIYSKKLVEFKTGLGLPLGKKTNIAIPNLILGNKEFVLTCIKGIFDTDGYVYIENKYGKPYPRLEIATTSEKLAEQIKTILQEENINCSVWRNNRRNVNWKPKFTISVRGYKNLEKWMKTIGTDNPRNKNKIHALYRRTL
jgi:hypothetical protein